MNAQLYPLPRNNGELTLHDVEADGPAPLPIGELLIEMGRLSPEESQRILDYQKKASLLYGEAGIALGLINHDDVRRALAVQFGHTLLPQRDIGTELVAASQPDSPAVEQLRMLRSQLMLRWFENDDRHIALAIVSPGAGEGRSFIAANLAVLFSQLGKRTLLIDADLRRPRQHRIFGLPGRIGLSGVLSGRAGFEAICEIKALPGLSVLPAGAIPPNPQELLGRNVFARLLTSLRGTYEVILLDTPSSKGCADASTIAARAGAALVLACRDRSPMSQVTRLAEDLRQFGVTVVGSVLNGVSQA